MDTPEWYLRSENKRGWVQIVVLVLGFAFLDCRHKQSEVDKNQIETLVKTATAEQDIRIRKLEADRAEHELAKSAADAILADTQSKKSVMPLVSLMPDIQIGSADRDVSEIRCELAFKNIGLVDARIENIHVKVFRAFTTDEVTNVIERTKRIAEIDDILSRPPLGGDQGTDFEKLRAERLELHKDCPHAQLFSVSGSKDVKWEELERLSDIRILGLTLRPGQEASERFVYLQTQSIRSHNGWFRLAVEAKVTGGPSQKFSFIIPTRPQGLSYFQKPVYEMRSSESPSSIYHWRPAAPLLPNLSNEKTDVKSSK